MQEILLLSMLLMVLCAVGFGTAFAAAEGKEPAKKGILLVAFGTSVAEAEKAYAQVEQQTGAAFPGVDIRWAYTSKTIRARLAARGRTLDSPETALARMMDEGITRAAVLSLHVIPGEEFHNLQRNAILFSQMEGGFDRVVVARPLLSSHDDMVRTATAMVKRVSSSITPENAVLLMGHGTPNHPADAVYAAMNYQLQDMSANILVATVSGYPTVDDLLPRLKERNVKKVLLAPLMAVAGEHARKDMAGEQKNSWKSVLAANGITCDVVLEGIAEYPEIVEIWLDHLREAFSRL